MRIGSAPAHIMAGSHIFRLFALAVDGFCSWATKKSKTNYGECDCIDLDFLKGS